MRYPWGLNEVHWLANCIDEIAINEYTLYLIQYPTTFVWNILHTINNKQNNNRFNKSYKDLIAYNFKILVHF